jgi:hypothetical protein
MSKSRVKPLDVKSSPGVFLPVKKKFTPIARDSERATGILEQVSKGRGLQAG